MDKQLKIVLWIMGALLTINLYLVKTGVSHLNSRLDEFKKTDQAYEKRLDALEQSMVRSLNEEKHFKSQLQAILDQLRR